MSDTAVTVAVWIVAGLLCLGGLLLSCLSLSGTWLVTAAAALLAWRSAPGVFPGWGTPVTFALLSGLVEGGEAVAGWLGATRRGGSRWTGAAAMAGGLLGALAGTVVIPVPLLGSLAGLLLGGFLAAYFVELHRRQDRASALHVASGVLLAQLFILLLKVVVTLGFILFLGAGLWLGR